MSRADVTVVVMDYVEGIHEEKEEDPYFPFKRFGLYDAQMCNYILSTDGKRYIVDLAV